MRVIYIRMTPAILALLTYFFSSYLALAQPASFTVAGDIDLFASPSGSQIGKLIAGKELTFTFIAENQSDDKGWVKIPIEGWIKKTSTSAKAGDNINIRIITKKDNLLVAPSKSVLAVISQGTEIEVLEVSKNWLKVRLSVWLPTSQTNLPLLYQSQRDNKASPSSTNLQSSESQQKITTNPAIIEKLPTILENLTLQEERFNSIVALLKAVGEKLTPLGNLDNQIKKQSEQQLSDTKSILEQLQKIKEKLDVQYQKEMTSDGAVTSPLDRYLVPSLSIPIFTILLIGFILWWLLYHRLNKLSGFNQFSEINERLVRNTESLQSLNTMTIRGFEEIKGIVGLSIEKSSSELRENLIKQLAKMVQEMNFFFTQSSQSHTKDFSSLRESIFKQLESNKNDINQLVTTNNQNQQASFSTFSDKTIILLMNSSKTTNESLQSLSKEIKNSFANLNEKVVSDLGSIQANLASHLGLINQSLNHSLINFNEKIIETLKEMQQTVTNSINMLNEKVLNKLGEMRTQLVSSTAESVQCQNRTMEEFRHKVGFAIDSSLKNSIDMLNNMFTELRNNTEKHLNLMNEKVEERLNKGFERNNEIFFNVVERLQQIDQAQQRISELSSNVVTLQRTLDSKGARGAFGEIQLVDLVRDAFPEKYVKFQYTMKNGKRPDCLLLLPPPTGNIAIDAKFPLENYLMMVNKDFTDQERINASKNFKRDIKKHIVDISDKYIVPGETAQGAVMFIPSEAVFAEIHAFHPDVVQEAQNRRVWITSPTTLMAVLTTARAVLADAERNKQAKIIHNHLIALSTEFNRFTKRMDELSRHIGQANTDVEQINITARKITNKFARIEKAEIDEPVGSLISDESLSSE